MKSTLFFLSLLLASPAFTQAPPFELSIVQNGKEISIVNRQAHLNKAPFQLIYKFKGPQNWGLIAGQNERMQNAFTEGEEAMKAMLLNANSGGADAYFNEDKSIRAWDGKIESNISYVDDQHHSFDSTYIEDDWVVGVRTVSFLSTKDHHFMVEEWPGPLLILATGNTEYSSSGKEALNAVSLQLHLKDIPNHSEIDVKGKTFNEVGIAEFQEGCEGCGNLGYYEFKKDGRQVEYLRSGSDMFSFGTYRQEKDQIIIADDEIHFTVSPDGMQLIHNEYGTIYKLAEATNE